MNSTEPRPAAGILLSLASGLLLALAFPPVDLGVVAFAAIAPLLLVVRRVPPGKAAQYGLLSGAAFFFPLLHWLTRVMGLYGGLPLPAAVAILALLILYLSGYGAAFAALTSAASRRWGWRGLLLAPVFWTGLELVRGRLLTGFPWGLAGYSQWRSLALLQLGTLGGVYLVSFVVLVANVGLTLCAARGLPRAARVAGVASLALVGAAGLAGGRMLGALPGAGQEGPPFKVAAIQANVAQGVKWQPGEQERIVGNLLEMTGRAARDGADLIVWPESSSPLSFRLPSRLGTGAGAAGLVEPRADFLQQVSDSLRPGSPTLIAGSVDYRYDAARLLAYNSVFVIGPGGGLGPSYAKIHLVPFGEYVPLSRILFFVDRMVQGAIAEFAPGDRLEPLPTPMGEAATFVCYEAIFPELVRALARRGAYLVNVTNDAWFGRSGAPRQHLAMAVFRAAENRRYLVRAANTGISAMINPYGRVVASTELETRTILSGSVRARTGLTLYTRTGDLFAWGCVIVTAFSTAALCAAFFRSRRRV